jgi:hypothetical protein
MADSLCFQPELVNQNEQYYSSQNYKQKGEYYFVLAFFTFQVKYSKFE